MLTIQATPLVLCIVFRLSLDTTWLFGTKMNYAGISDEGINNAVINNAKISNAWIIFLSSV